MALRRAVAPEILSLRNETGDGKHELAVKWRSAMKRREIDLVIHVVHVQIASHAQNYAIALEWHQI